jgi:hypothetical protein
VLAIAKKRGKMVKTFGQGSGPDGGDRRRHLPPAPSVRDHWGGTWHADRQVARPMGDSKAARYAESVVLPPPSRRSRSGPTSVPGHNDRGCRRCRCGSPRACCMGRTDGRCRPPCKDSPASIGIQRVPAPRGKRGWPAHR